MGDGFEMWGLVKYIFDPKSPENLQGEIIEKFESHQEGVEFARKEGFQIYSPEGFSECILVPLNEKSIDS